MTWTILLLTIWGIAWPTFVVTEGFCSQLRLTIDSRHLDSLQPDDQQLEFKRSSPRQQEKPVLEAVERLRAEVAALSSRVPTVEKADRACLTIRRLEADMKALEVLRIEVASLSSRILTIEKADHANSKFQWLEALQQSILQVVHGQRLAEQRLHQSIVEPKKEATHLKQPATEENGAVDAILPPRVSYTKLAQTTQLFTWHGKIVKDLVTEAAWIEAWENSLPIQSTLWSRLFWKDPEHSPRREEDFDF